MTIIATWIAQNIENSENKYLVVASDSRVTGGGAWDCCPKIFPLGREDSVIAFRNSILWNNKFYIPIDFTSINHH